MKPSLVLANDILEVVGAGGLAMDAYLDDNGQNLPVVRIDRFNRRSVWVSGQLALLIIIAMGNEANPP